MLERFFSALCILEFGIRAAYIMADVVKKRLRRAGRGCQTTPPAPFPPDHSHDHCQSNDQYHQLWMVTDGLSENIRFKLGSLVKQFRLLIWGNTL